MISQRDAVQDPVERCPLTTLDKSTTEATRKGMPVSFACYCVRLSAHAHGEGGVFALRVV